MRFGRPRVHAWRRTRRCRWTTCVPWCVRAAASAERDGAASGRRKRCYRIRAFCGGLGRHCAVCGRRPWRIPSPVCVEVHLPVAMSIALASDSWPRPHAPRGAGPWVFGREVTMAASPDDPDAPRALQWLLRRNCSITPGQLCVVFLLLCIVSLLIGSFLLAQGAPVVLSFAGLELLLAGALLMLFARHAGDRETLTLVGRSLQVEQRIGSRVERTLLAADWLHVEPAGGQGSLVQLSARGQEVRVGRFLRPELRGAFARELRLAVRRVPAPSGTEIDTN
ncbi:MAG: hypothetical protein C0505_16110 [Leptothrix sp. (in: Bacteria)]|nr:hypothetical protein [Leptothrix sp. (in: b-proteobacteria)]